MADIKYIRNVTDRFSLFDTVRKFTDQNDRRYLISSLKELLNSPKTKEHQKLRELIGFLGHTKRMEYAKRNNNNIWLPESTIMMIDGKALDVINIPANVNLDTSVSDDGIVTHTEQILDNDVGRVVDDLLKAKVGGWSWATRGSDGAVSIPRDFAGFDYVYGENFISLDKQSLMLESSGNKEEQMLDLLVSQNVKKENALSIVQFLMQDRDNNLMFENAVIVPTQQMELIQLRTRKNELSAEITELTNKINALNEKEKSAQLMLESTRTANERRKRVFDSLPVILDADDIEKILNPKDDDDVAAAKLIFESVMNKNTSDLPLGNRKSLGDIKINKGLQDSIPEPLFSIRNEGTGFE